MNQASVRPLFGFEWCLAKLASVRGGLIDSVVQTLSIHLGRHADSRRSFAIPLFSGLPATELERLARNSADLQLAAGEFAVHEGGEGALFVVLSGRIEVVKTFDGVERRLGQRLPGTIFGEVPITLGSPFPGGYRAAEPSRVMRIEVQQYYAIASVSRDVAQKVNALARERLGGLQAIAAEPQKPRVTLIGHRWDTACADLRRFLARNQISFDWVLPDAPEAAALVDASRGAVDGPVARLMDGTVIEKPEVRDLANRLGLQTRPHEAEYDVAIVGGGPAASRRRFTERRKGCAPSSSSARLPAGRQAHRRASRTIWVFRAAFRATNWPAARFSRRGGWAPKSW